MKRRAFSRNDSEEIIAHISEKKHTSLKVDGNRCFKLKIQQKEKKVLRKMKMNTCKHIFHKCRDT